MWRTPLRAVWDVSHQETETLWWPSSRDVKVDGSTQPNYVMFFVPGNPGLIEYYTEFLEAIHQSMPNLEIYGVSHLGHSLGHHSSLSNGTKVFTLQDQISHKVNCFDTLVCKHPLNTRFILMGHSVGSYICAEILKRRPDAPITRLIALFPTLREIALTPNGITATRLFSLIPSSIPANAAAMASWMPQSIRLAMTHWLTGQNGSSLSVTAHQLLHGPVIRNVIAMARFEMEEIKELDHDFYTTHAEKFVVYYSKNDKWAPEDHFMFMKERYPAGNAIHEYNSALNILPADVYLCALDLPHAFVLDSKHVEYMAQQVHSWLKETGNEKKRKIVK